MLGSGGRRLVVSASIVTTRLLYWTSLTMAGVIALLAVPDILLSDGKDALFLLSFVMVAGIGNRLSTKLSHIILQNGVIELATLTEHRVVSQAEFVLVQAMGAGIMRMNFLSERPAYFLLNSRVLIDNDEETIALHNQLEMWFASHSTIASLDERQQASLATKRIIDWLKMPA